jgi:tetratricopeptide (TPR) repeat protein
MSTTRTSLSMIPRLAALALLVLLAGAADALDWVREGNRAFDRGEFVSALEYYTRAEPVTLDPGLVAFNKAAAYYQLRRFAESAESYRRCLEDAVGARRVRALYGLANALAQDGHQRHGRAGLDLLLQAKARYEECLALEAALPPEELAACRETFENARRNLQLIEPVLARKKDEADHPEERGPNNGSAQPHDPGPTPTKPGGTSPDTGTRPRPPNGFTTAPSGHGPPQPTNQYQPGKGNLPPIPDTADAPPIDPARARELLQGHIERIRQDRANHVPAEGGPPTGAKDW